MKILIITLLLIISFKGFACSPQQGTWVPPNNSDGDPSYIAPPTKEDQFIALLREAMNFGVVVSYLEYRSNTNPEKVQNEFELLFGWGEPQSRIIKFVRFEDSCGKPESYPKGRKYVVIFKEGQNPTLIEYKLLESFINERGNSDYYYTINGMVKN